MVNIRGFDSRAPSSILGAAFYFFFFFSLMFFIFVFVPFLPSELLDANFESSVNPPRPSKVDFLFGNTPPGIGTRCSRSFSHSRVVWLVFFGGRTKR